MTLVDVCSDCGWADGGHGPDCPRWVTTSEYDRLKGQKDAILAKQKERGDALMTQLEGTLMGKLREMEGERDGLKLALEGALKMADTFQEKSINRGIRLVEQAVQLDRMQSTVTRQRSEIDTLRASAQSPIEDLERMVEVFRQKQIDAYDAPIERSIYADVIDRLERLIRRSKHAAKQVTT